jgi:hypothetical protein
LVGIRGLSIARPTGGSRAVIGIRGFARAFPFPEGGSRAGIRGFAVTRTPTVETPVGWLHVHALARHPRSAPWHPLLATVVSAFMPRRLILVLILIVILLKILVHFFYSFENR